MVGVNLEGNDEEIEMRRKIYIGLAIVGAVLPYMFFLGVFHSEILIAGFIPATWPWGGRPGCGFPRR